MLFQDLQIHLLVNCQTWRCEKRLGDTSGCNGNPHQKFFGKLRLLVVEDILRGCIQVIGVEYIISRLTRMVQSEVGLIIQDEVVISVTTIHCTTLHFCLNSLNECTQWSLELFSALDWSVLLEHLADIALGAPNPPGNPGLWASRLVIKGFLQKFDVGFSCYCHRTTVR